VNDRSGWSPALDDLRAIAITLVVVMHGYSAFYPRPADIENPLMILVYAGGTGVGLFFCLSGFLVSRPFIRALLYGRGVSYVEYAIHRAMRVLPLYFFVVFVAGFCTGSWEKVPAAMLFLVGGKEMGSFSHVWWSLAVEVHFYLMAPFLYLLFSRKWNVLLFAVFF
jgi:peptidoglycan/LPS O-acetylase OafA/YrhL